jgi:hypothetical protein
METPSVSSDHDGLASIGRRKAFENSSAYLAGSATYCGLSHPCRNYELIERASAAGAGATMNAEPMVARGMHNRASI